MSLHQQEPLATGSPSWLGGGGEMGRLMRAMDWSSTPLGPVGAWPQSLRTIISTCLNSRYPILVWWGREMVMLYNDAYRQLLGSKHPRSLGQRGQECWAEIWDIIGPMLHGVLERGEATWSEAQMLAVLRSGFTEECYFTFSYSPIHVETGEVGGVFCAVTEVTRQVVDARRLRTLRALADRSVGAHSVREACELTTQALAEAPADVPFALVYLLDGGWVNTLAGVAGLPAGAEIDRRLHEAADCGEAALIEGLQIPGGAWPEPVHSALVLPITSSGVRLGAVVLGLSPRLGFDDGYRGFCELVADHLGRAVASARAFEEEKRRAEALAALDRAKTAFFSNVSHEFRTPLTLLLGPLEDALRERADRAAEEQERLELMHRNAVRLGQLVNTMLEFSRIEAGRVEATFVPVDLAALTREIASSFEPMLTRAGLGYRVDAGPLPEKIYVDPGMWERILLNLLSNAFKFTFEGEIAVAVSWHEDQVVVAVRDTGVGIPAAEVPRVFERFHRVPGARSRTHEGSGIGLAFVHELVRLHGGHVTVDSVEGKGTTFAVHLPRGKDHLPADRIGAEPVELPTLLGATPFLTEAGQWLRAGGEGRATADALPAGPRARILVVDDNADMRAYLQRVLGAVHDVEAVADGASALRAARAHEFDLVLTDVMMPGLDGFQLLHALRSDPRTQRIPTVMVSARAGEEARAEGMEAGADDYLVKPFSARELLARVSSQIALGRARRALLEANRTKDEFLAMLGHELRNPLAPIATALQLLKLRGDERTAREQTIIERQVRHMTRLLDDLLDVSRITRGMVELERVQVNLSDVVARALETVGPLIESRRHQLDISVPRKGMWIDGDEARLTQVLTNLLTNAAKYSAPEGRISLTARRLGDDIVITVSDTGVGIEPELLDAIFEPFKQGARGIDRSEGGLGLGLAIVRTLVELHGGSVIATSAGRGRGSEFTVRLPACDGPEVVATAAHRAAPVLAPAASPRRVLVVDDNVDAADTIAELLREAGHAVEVAHDGPAALAAAGDFGPEVALLDIGLPVMDGYELARRLRASFPQVRMVALSGYGQASDHARSLAAGFELHIVKPVSVGKLLAAIDGDG